MTVTEAQRALTNAKAKVTEAEAARREAAGQLDEALANAGWHRLVGGFSATATPLYTNRLYPGACLEVGDILEVLERQAAPA